MKILFRLVAVILTILMFHSMAVAGQKLKVGVIQLIAKHPDHIELRKGFMETLKEKGYEVEITMDFDADSVTYPDTYKKRGADEALKMEAAGVDLIFCTAMYHALTELNLKTPVIDSVFLQPEKYSVSKEGKLFIKGNATGTIFGYSFKDIIDFIHDSMPNAKKIAYLHSPSQGTSKPIAEIEVEAQKYGISIVDCPFPTAGDAEAAVEKAIASADAGFLTNCMAVLGVENIILGKASTKNFPIIVAINPHVELGAVAGIQSDWYRAGEMCGLKAIQVLKGTPANSIPIEFSDRVKTVINVKLAQKMNLMIPYTYLQSANRIIE